MRPAPLAAIAIAAVTGAADGAPRTAAGTAMPYAAGEWIAWCSSGAPCSADYAPRGEAPGFTLSLRGADQRRGAVALVVTPPSSVARGARLRLAVDGTALADLQAPGDGNGLALPLDRHIAPPMRRGRLLTLAAADGTSLGAASLSGLGAVLAWLAGARPLAAAPAIAVPAPTDKPPRTLSTKDAARLIPSRPCGALPPPGVGRAVRLDAHTSLALVAAPCGGGYVLQPLLVDEKGRIRLADMDAVPAITRADWDAATRRLVLMPPSQAGARCTGERRYAWNGVGFVLAERRWQCAGRAAPIVTFQAAVIAD